MSKLCERPTTGHRPVAWTGARLGSKAAQCFLSSTLDSQCSILLILDIADSVG